MTTEEMLAQAQRQDLNRQRQIEAQQMSINRLLEARESDVDDATVIQDLTIALTDERKQVLDLQAKIDAVGNIVSSWDDEARDRLVEVLGRG
jgi:hypothetical protein